MSTLAEIEAAIPNLTGAELAELERLVSVQRAKQSNAATIHVENLWSGARERLQRVWGERMLNEKEIARMRDFEDGE